MNAMNPFRKDELREKRIGWAVLAMDLAQGGHLTHGSRVNFSGRNLIC